MGAPGQKKKTGGIASGRLNEEGKARPGKWLIKTPIKKHQTAALITSKTPVYVCNVPGSESGETELVLIFLSS
jgi:hypothetical protein